MTETGTVKNYMKNRGLIRNHRVPQRDTLCSPTKCTKYLTAEITVNAGILKSKKKIVTSANSAYSAVNANNREL
jgi:hypothetical protein